MPLAVRVALLRRQTPLVNCSLAALLRSSTRLHRRHYSHDYKTSKRPTTEGYEPPYQSDSATSRSTGTYKAWREEGALQGSTKHFKFSKLPRVQSDEERHSPRNKEESRIADEARQGDNTYRTRRQNDEDKFHPRSYDGTHDAKSDSSEERFFRPRDHEERHPAKSISDRARPSRRYPDERTDRGTDADEDSHRMSDSFGRRGYSQSYNEAGENSSRRMKNKSTDRKAWRSSHVTGNPYAREVPRPELLPEDMALPDESMMEDEDPMDYLKQSELFDEDGQFTTNRPAPRPSEFYSTRKHNSTKSLESSSPEWGRHWLQQFHQELMRRDQRPADMLTLLLRVMSFPPSALSHSYLPVYAHHVRQALQIIVGHREQRTLRPRMVMLNAMDRLYQRIRVFRDYEFNLALVQNQIVAERHGLRMTEDELAKRTAEAPTVRAWDRLRAMPLINDLLAESWVRSYRRPQLYDLHDALKTFVPDKVRKRTYTYNIMLHLILRTIPASRRDGTNIVENMDNIPMSRLRMRWDELRSSRDSSLMDIRVHIPESYDDRQPLAGFELFEMVWKALLQEDRPDAITYSLALSMESRLASYRAAKIRRSLFRTAKGIPESDRRRRSDVGDEAAPELSSREEEESCEGATEQDTAAEQNYDHADDKIAPWDPVLDALDIIRRRQQHYDIFKVEHINLTMWAAMRYDPNGNVVDSLTPDDTDWIPRVPWPSRKAVMDTYATLRGNLLRQEMANLQEGPVDAPPSRLSGSSPAEVEMAESVRSLVGPKGGNVDNAGLHASLPAHFVPTLATYELLIHGLAFHGDLRSALQVLNDMTQTPVPASQQKKPFQVSNAHAEASFAPSPCTYNSFFLGFCRHGTPSQLVSFNTDDPSQSEWEPVDDEIMRTRAGEISIEYPSHIAGGLDDRTPLSDEQWNMDTLSRLIEAFLSVETTALLPIHRAVGREKTLDHTESESRLMKRVRRNMRNEEDLATFARMAEDSHEDLSSIGLFDDEYRPLLLNKRSWRDLDNVRIAELNELHRRHWLGRKFADDDHQELLRPVLEPINDSLTAKSLLVTNAETEGPPPPELQPRSSTQKWKVQPATLRPQSPSPMAKSLAPMENPTRFANAPTQQELFHFLTALRRVSNDNAQWTLAQFARVAAKFGPTNATRNANVYDVWGESVNAEGWTGWKLDNRLDRTLMLLYNRRDGRADDVPGEWRPSYRQDVGLEVVRRRAALHLQRQEAVKARSEETN